MSTFKKFFASFFAVILGFTACKGIDKAMKKKIEQLETFTYKFGDSSVPPPYHRSYTISVSDSVHLTVDSYGEILADKTYPLPEKGLETIKDLLKKHKIQNRTRNESNGCSGGTTKSISFTCKEEESFSGSVYICSGKQYGNIQGEIEAFANDFTAAFVPDLSEVIRATE